jgi:alpha-1,3-glucan synthase
MPGWWYTIESTTTKHLLAQFEHACREALSSDQHTRESMRAISAKQRFPVIEWIRKLDKLQMTAIKMCEDFKKSPTAHVNSGFRGSFQKLATPRSSFGSSALESRSSLNAVTPPVTRNPLHGSASSSRCGSMASSAISDPIDVPIDRAEDGTTFPLPRNTSNASLKDMADDTSSIEPSELQKGLIEPALKGPGLSKLSLGSRLGPGHARLKKYESVATIESLGQIDEEQHYGVSDEDEDGAYLSSVNAIRRRQIAKNQRQRTGGTIDLIETSDLGPDLTSSPDISSIYEFDPQRASVVVLDPDENHNKPNTYHDSLPKDPVNIVSGTQIHSPTEQKTMYADGISPPVTPPLRHAEGSYLSLASVLGGREDFALSKVEDVFTDADGKYFKRFSSELEKTDTKTSKDELCIEEFIVKSEKEWANAMRNKKLGIESLFGGDLKGSFARKIPTVRSQNSDETASETSSELRGEEPLSAIQRPTGIRLFFQRRIRDWPFYSFLIALVEFS